MRKPACCISENKGADQHLCFCYVHRKNGKFVCFLNPNFQAFNHFLWLLWLYSQLCVRLSRKPPSCFLRQVFSRQGSYSKRYNTGFSLVKSYYRVKLHTGSIRAQPHRHACRNRTGPGPTGQGLISPSCIKMH